MKTNFLFIIFLVAKSCNRHEGERTVLEIIQVRVGETELDLQHPMKENLPVNRPITVYFSNEIEAASLSGR